jgi:4-hydroxy-tetrahydrodipicolinate reductase
MGRVFMAGLPDERGIEVVGGLRRAAPDKDALLAKADVLVDFTNRESAPELMLEAIAAGVRPVSGTSGLAEDALAEVDAAARKRGLAAVWASNFRLGGALMMHLAEIVARFFDSVDIIEAHHATKADAPSGTALTLARRIHAAHGTDLEDAKVRTMTLPGVRGGELGGVRVHSLRQTGVLGWHEVVFAGDEEVLTIRHDEYSRGSYVGTVARAVREVMRPDRIGLISGYDAVIGLTHEAPH